jgi:hypothetical protein
MKLFPIPIARTLDSHQNYHAFQSQVNQKNNINVNMMSSFLRSHTISLRMSKHFRDVLYDFQCFLKLIYPKAKMLKKCVVERKANLQLGEKEGHAILGAIS